MNPEIIFVIPFVAGIAWVLREAVLYNLHMIAMIAMIGHNDFTLVKRDGLLYVVPNVQQEERLDCDDGDKHRE